MAESSANANRSMAEGFATLCRANAGCAEEFASLGLANRDLAEASTQVTCLLIGVEPFAALV